MDNLKLREPILTRHLVAFETTWNAGESPTGKFTIAAHVVRSAVTAGWFENGAIPEDVDELPPSELLRLQDEVNDHYNKVTAVDPNS